jgi:hypothetical protein
MVVTFANGNDQQKEAVRFVLHHLLNLSFDDIPLEVVYEFVADPDPALHNEFAVTEYTYDSRSATTKVGSVAPNWGEPYRGIRFLNETVAHETGHALFAALPQAARVAIAEMFGATSDDIEELAPDGSDWEDRIIEGIAETFKDAFLPQRYRLYSNRTNHKLPVHRHPEFRALWRQATPEIPRGGVPLGVGETAVPAYNFDYLAEGEPLPLQGFAPPFYLAATDGKHGIHSTAMNGGPDIIPERGNSYFIAGESVASAWVKHGTVLSFTLALDDGAFPDQQNEFRFDLFYHSFVAGPIFPTLFSGRWLSQLEDPEFPRYSEEEVDGLLIGDPPFSHAKLITVDGLFTKTRMCNGTVYRFVELVGFVRATYLGAYTLADHEALRAAYLYPYLPELRIVQPVCPKPPESGTPIVLPSPALEPVGVKGGSRRKNRLISGGRTS